MSGASGFDLSAYLARWAGEVDRVLDELLPPAEGLAAHVCEAMRYSVFAGGKRLRPILCIAGCVAAGGKPESAMRTGAALEMIHAYSLIHDDLPAMDNDDFRRGRPTCHKQFGEAMAILAGDGLLTEAFAVIAEDPGLAADTKTRLIAELAQAAGARGLVAGQVADMEKEGAAFTESDLVFIHDHKTAALIAASVVMGGIIAHGSAEQIRALHEYGRLLGRAFQISDDVLNVTGGKELGKAAGTDSARGKATYPARFGIEGSQKLVKELCGQAGSALAAFDDRAAPLRALAEWLVVRKK